MADESSSAKDATTPCPAQKESEKCATLRRQIDELINRNKHDPSVPNFNKGRHGLVHRFREFISNLWRLGDAPSSEAIADAQSHIDEIKKAQDDLTDKLQQLSDNKCGDPPRTAWSWATRPVKELQEQVDAAKKRRVTDLAKTGVAAGAGITAGYVLYRIVRMIPSLFPPLWETIPINLAVP